MNAALYLGLIRGYPDGTLGPNRNINFEEALMILLRATGYEPYLVGDWPHKVFDKARELGLDQGVVVIPPTPCP